MNKALLFSIIIVLVLAAGLFFFPMTSSGKNVDFKEAAERKDEVYINGKVDHVLSVAKNSPIQSFYMIDKNGNEKQVVLMNHQPKPEDFKMWQEVEVIGRMMGNEFVAKEVLVKCVDHYKS